MALPQDETINEQPSIDYEALGLEPVEDEDVFGGGIDAEVDEAKKPVSGEIDYEGLGLEPVEEEDVFGVTQEEPIPVTGEEGFLRQVADVPLKIGESINNSIKGITDLFGADNAISQNLSQNADWYRSLLSAQALEDEQEIGRILKEAEDEGILGQLGAGLEAFSVAPVDFVASGIGSLATFAATGVAGRAAALAGAARAGLTGAKAAQFVQRGVQATQLATGAAMGAGIVKGEIYQSVKDEMLAQGKTEEDAKRIATEAQSYMGKNLDQILLGAGLGTIDAFTGAEKILGKVLTKGGLKPDASRIGNIIKNGLTEAAPEFIQAAQEKFASNLALQREGVNVPLTQGVFSQGALEGLVGLGLGAGAGAIEPRIQTPPTKEEVSAAAAETQDVARQNKDIVPATASLVEGEAEQIIQSQAETPDERVARLQREAQEAAGDIELEEEGAGLPPQPVTPTPEAPPVEPVAPVGPVVPTEEERPARPEIEAIEGESELRKFVRENAETIEDFELVDITRGEGDAAAKELASSLISERAKQRLKTRIDEGKTALLTQTPEGDVFANSGNDENFNVKLDLLPEERRALSAANADREFAENPEEVANANAAIQEAVRPAVERAVSVPAVAEVAPEVKSVRQFKLADVEAPTNLEGWRALRNERIAAERQLLQEEIGLTPEQAEGLHEIYIVRDSDNTDRWVKRNLTPEQVEKFEAFDEGPFNQRGGPVEFLEYDSDFNPEFLDVENDTPSLANAIVQAFTKGKPEQGLNDKWIYAVGAIQKLEAIGGSRQDISDALTQQARRVAGSEGDAEFWYRERGREINETIEAFAPNLPTERGAAPVAVAPTPEVREARREPPVEIQQQYAPKTDEEQQSFDRASTNKILARSPQLAVAAVRLKNGEITAGEYADLVDVLDPFVVKGAEPVPTNEKIYQYMSQTAGGKPTSEQGKEKLSKIGVFKKDGTQRIPNGKLAEFRIDIPTYNESTKNGDTVYSITGHEPVSETATQVGKTIAHLGIAKITNPQFITRTISGKGDAIQIAMGAGKFPLATVKGNYEAITELPADINDPNVWTETGYNPVRSSELVDVRSKKALVGGTEAIMVGSRVFVKNAQLEARPTGVTMGERYARRVQMGRAGMEQAAVEARLQELGFPTGGIIRVVNQPDADFEGRTIILDGKVTGIELNASAMRDNATIDRVLNHEFAESANADGALNKLVERLTPKEKKEINDTITRLRYEERARTSEEAARAIETLAEAWKGRGFFTRAVARVEAWASKLGFKLTRRAAEYIAARNLAEVNENVRKWHISDALANLNGARRVTFNGLSAVLIPPSEMRLAYSIAAYHGTPHRIKGGFQLKYVGTGEGATAYGWGLYFAENQQVAEQYRKQLSYKDNKAYQDSQNKPIEELLPVVFAEGNTINIFGTESKVKSFEISEEDFTAVLEDGRVINKNTLAQSTLNVRSQYMQMFGGNIYNVDLDINENELLDWDLPISEQSKFVKNALEKAGWTSKGLASVSKMYGNSGKGLYDAIDDDLNSKQAASESLLKAGIKGIRYLDQGSRVNPKDIAKLQELRTEVQQLTETIEKNAGKEWAERKMFTDWLVASSRDLASMEKFVEVNKTTYNYVVFDENLIKITGLNGQPVDIRESRREPEAIPTFTEGTPEAATLKEMEASMAKVDAASEAKGGKPETYKISEIASVWMDSGLGERELQDAIVEYTNLTPANAAKVAKAIARQYDIQQSIATAFLETQTGLSVEALPEGVTLPKEVDPDRPKPVMQRLFDVFMGVRVPPVKIEVNEKTALKQQIRLKAAANRAAKAEQKRTAEDVVEIIKAMELLGPVRPKQVQALAKRAARVIWTSEKSVEAFSEYAAKVVENANYDADLRAAKDAQKRAKQLSKQKKVAMSPQRQILEDVGKIPVNKLDDPRMFAEAVNYYLRGFKDVLSPDYVVIPDAEMESYLSGAQSETQRNQRDLDREANKRLAEKYGIDPDLVNEMMESFDILRQIEAQENREALENLLTEKAVETQQGLRGYDTDNLSAEQRPIVAAMLKIDPKALDSEERQRFIRITNNIIYNNQTNGSEYFLAVAKGQQSAREAAQDSTTIAKNRAWINLLPRFISERMQRGWALELQSVADTFRNAFGKGAMAKMYDAIGMLDLNLGFTKANNVIDEIQEKIAEFHRNLEKKYKAAARNQDGLLAEGVVGFLIQSVPKKDEVSSINQRRDLIKQDIANRKAATMEPDRVAMANRIEAILNRVDGESVEAILKNMKREFPANHESLVWYKDTLLPQYKDFLKSFDENFNDQANNYENPNYLTIGFTSAGPSLAITPEEQSLFYDQVSLRPKQSAYTIKRVDYTTLPTDRTTGKPKEIEFNLRRNVFNGLSDQINKAYTSSGWQRIASFMKTPEAEIVFGGAANKDFFIERLNRLRLSRMRRGSMGSGGAIEKAVDSLSVISRKLGTGIALGGIYQWIKQPPDQLITALGSGGRYDLLAKNIAPSTQKAARELLNKFSIGRRGDASSGYKYINQMEGHQNRLERYFSESKWDQVKEQAGKVADVWMVALKSSDFLAASAAWMTYYEGELNKQDIKIDDWSKEAALIESDPKRRQAAAFAEQMTDIYQGSSDPTSMATFAQSGKTGWENLVKAIFVPFNSFAIQQRMRLYSDARDVLNGSAGGKGGLAGTIGGLILFHATKRYAIPAISGAGIAVLYGLMGVDMEEPDEEKQKEEANKNWRQFLADITGNLLVGGTPQIVESQFIDAMNRASYLVSLQLENDSIFNDEGEIMSYDQYSKERSPFYRYKSFDNAMSLGMLEIGLGQAEQVALQTKMLATPEEMEMYTPEEQRLLYFSALSEWLYLMRLNDADFARLVSKARRDMIKAAEEREKEIKRIREGR